MEKVVSIRGAITVKENTVNEVKAATTKLISQVLKENALEKENIINIVFTVTDDINSVNPATIAREQFSLELIPMLCVQEMKMKDCLPKCIRVMMQAYTKLTKDKIRHLYLGEATNLRPDLNYDI